MTLANWSDGLMERDDNELVEVPFEVMLRACERLGIRPPESDEPDQLPAWMVKKAYGSCTTDG